MKYKKSLFLLTCILLSTFTLASCGDKESTSPLDTSSSSQEESTTSDDGKDDAGRTHVSGPSQTDMPDIDTPSIPDDDPIYDEDIDINPDWPKDVQTTPSNYNIYFYSANNAVRDCIWLWGGSGGGGVGLPVTETNVALDGIDVTFSGIYLKSDAFYNCYTSWSDTTSTSYFRMKMSQPFTGCKIKDLEGNTSNPNDITLPAPNSDSTEPFNVYIVEKEDGDADAFTTISEANDFLTDATPAVWPKEATTQAADVNFYYYSDKGNSSIYFWGGANAELPASTTTTFDGIDLTFNAIYLQNGVKYNGYKGRWKYNNDDGSVHEAEQTTISFTLKAATSLTGCLLKNDDGTSKSADITLPSTTETTKNYYIVEKGNSAKAYSSLDSLKEALSSTVETKTPADETEAQDLNIYYTASKSSYNSGWAGARGALYGWNDNNGELAFNMTTSLFDLEGITTYKFSTAFIKFGTNYVGYNGWTMDTTTETTFNFAFIDEFKTQFTGFLIRNVAGAEGNKSPNADYDSSKLTADSNGKYNIYLVDDWTSETGNKCYAYYTLADLKSALGQ